MRIEQVTVIYVYRHALYVVPVCRNAPSNAITPITKVSALRQQQCSAKLYRYQCCYGVVVRCGTIPSRMVLNAPL